MAGYGAQVFSMHLHQAFGFQGTVGFQGAVQGTTGQDRLPPSSPLCALRAHDDRIRGAGFVLTASAGLDSSSFLGPCSREPCRLSGAPADASRSRQRRGQGVQAEAQHIEEAALPSPWFSPSLERLEDADAPSSTFASSDMSKPKWKRVLLKISGEALAGDKSSNVDPEIVMRIAREVAAIARLGVEVAVTVGGGNFFRGSKWAGASGLDRASADQIGMLATVMNAIFLQASLESLGCPTRVQTAFKMAEVAEPYIRRRAMRHLEKGRVVIFGAGTGNPFFTTDTAAALRAAEINAEVVLKATNVDGVYDCDPKHNASARMHRHVSYDEVARDRLSVMDATAITLCAENAIPVVVFNLNVPGNIMRALKGERIGTLIDVEGIQDA